MRPRTLRSREKGKPGVTYGRLGGCLADLQKINLLRTCGVPIMCLIANREAQKVGREHIVLGP